jgi:hypothetical protein
VPELLPVVRLGWLLAEVRGRHRPDGPRPPVAAIPAGQLPLRHQRSEADALAEAVHALKTRVQDQGLDDGTFASELDDALADPRGWPAAADFFSERDRLIQNALAEDDEDRANAYLLGRGLAECYWGLTTDDPVGTLLRPGRRTELTRMLGRLPADTVHEATPAAVAGSLAAWGAVAEDEDWSGAPHARDALYAQVRTWYQLVVLHQDPTTLIRPYDALSGLRDLGRRLRLYWPHLLTGALGIASVTGVLAVADDAGDDLLTQLLATSGLGAVTVAGLAARGQSAAQKIALRLRQDAYADLVAVSLAVVPEHPSGRTRRRTELAVRQRTLTVATPAP